MTATDAADGDPGARTPPSLRTTLLVGLMLLNLAVVGGMGAVVWARARSDAHDAFNERLRLHANAFASGVEIDDEGIEFEAPEQMTAQYSEPGGGAYAVVYDASGKAVVRSPSLDGRDLDPVGAWSDGEYVFTESENAPDGFPCAFVSYSFTARVEDHDDAEGWTPPAEEQRRFRIVVGADSRPRDMRLAGFLKFVVAACAGALALTLLGGLLVARRVLGPIHRMTAEAQRLTPSDTSRRLRRESVVRELRSLSDTLNSALDRLGNALDRQRRFVSDASHELRTPLAVLLGNADLMLRSERTSEQYRKGIERQRRVAQRMTRMTENLLALARADAGEEPSTVDEAPVDLGTVAENVVDELRPLAESVDVDVDVDVAGELPVAVPGASTQIAALLQNLVANAVKFTPPEGRVEVDVARNGRYALIDVRDSGPGIPESERERVFERFHRVREGRDASEGAGLGLAIVKWVVDRHGGDITIDDADGGGAHVRVRLPFATA